MVRPVIAHVTGLFDHMDWEIFCMAADDIETQSVDFSGNVKVYPNQKPWLNSDVRKALPARNTAFAS